MAEAEGKRFHFDSESCIRKDYLEVFEFASQEQIISIVTDEFSAVCPFSGLPDVARVEIEYTPNSGLALELKSLKYYFFSYRNVGVYQERVTQLLRMHLEEVLKTRVWVRTVYNTRGGIDVVCTEGLTQKVFTSTEDGMRS